MKDYVLKEKSEPASNDIVWAFDLGKGSIGEAVRQGTNFLHKASLLIPAEFAETKTARDRRRMHRTREAHKAREKWLRRVMQEAGIEILHGRNYDASGNWKPGEPADKRLEQEFPSDGDKTCYTSCLLRIKLMRGEKLEPWQVFKAFHSAIQRRGYDPNIPWKTRESRNRTVKEGEDDKAGTEDRMRKFQLDLESMAPGQKDFHFPAYFDAYQMGLWNPARPNELKLRSDCHAKTTRNQIVPRKLVEEEIRKMVEGAAKHYPALAGKADYLLYGPTEKPYASFNSELRKEHDLKEGGENDWQGVVGQKIPRFDNRIIAKCALIPRLNVCKLREGDKGQPHKKSLVAIEVTFLMKLKNLRIQRPGGVGSLTADEIRGIHEDQKRKDWKFTKSAWKKYCVSVGAVPLPGHEEVEAPRLSGRSRFCRPALEVLKRLILSGKKPSEFLHDEIARLNGNKDPLKGLVESDLKFLTDMAARNDTWEGIYIPNQQLDAIAQSSSDPGEAIRRLIGQQNDPVVRHRLTVFYQRLCELEKSTGMRPDSVVLEFVREDFMGKKAKLEYYSFIKKRAQERVKAREEAAKVGATEKSAGLKLELLRAQDGHCLYTDEGLIPSKLDEYQIEHIVPRAQGGPDAVVNFVLTTQKTNDAKGDRTPYEWFHQKMPEKWDAYVNRVRARATHLRNKKVQLLISPNAAELAERYTALAETAWIAKLAQTIVGLQFGWRNGMDENGNKRVTVISGGLTGRIRRKYALNQVLNPNAKTEEEAERKNRDDDRHHALDAMVISFIPGWARDAKKEKFFRFPESIHKNAKGFFEKEIAPVIPRSLCFEKSVLAESIYGARGEGADRVIVQRVELLKLAYTTVKQKQVFDLDYLGDQIKAVRDAQIQKLLTECHAKMPDEGAWKNFCETFRLPRKDGNPGPRVLSVLMNVGEPKEYKDLSKDGTGAYRKALKGHKGQIVYVEISTDKKGATKESAQVRPVYAFESQAKVSKELADKFGASIRVIGFFQSGCLVEVDKPVAHAKQPLPPGKYRLNTILTDSKNVKVTTADGKTYPDIPRFNLGNMIAAGFKRAD
jgi:CRISPR-associated endonuclease Csn1